MWIFCGMFAILFQFGSSVVGRPLAAVGADLSCPHIRIYPQNGEQKCVCGDLNIRILRCGHPFAMKWIYVFNNGKIRIWQCKDTGTMNRSPTPGGVFVGCFGGVRWYFAECKLGVFVSVRWEFRGWTLIFCGVFATCSFCVCYMFAKQKYGFCRVKVWFLACKKGVFALQKYGFCFLNVVLLQFV